MNCLILTLILALILVVILVWILIMILVDIDQNIDFFQSPILKKINPTIEKNQVQYY